MQNWNRVWATYTRVREMKTIVLASLGEIKIFPMMLVWWGISWSVELRKGHVLVE